jgi:hypothetical protein
VLLLEEELDRLVLRVVHDEVDGGSATIAGGVPDLTVHLERGTTQVQQCLHQDQWRAHAGIMQKTSSDSATCEGGKRDMLAKWKGRFFLGVDFRSCWRWRHKSGRSHCHRSAFL